MKICKPFLILTILMISYSKKDNIENPFAEWENISSPILRAKELTDVEFLNDDLIII